MNQQYAEFWKTLDAREIRAVSLGGLPMLGWILGGTFVSPGAGTFFGGAGGVAWLFFLMTREIPNCPRCGRPFFKRRGESFLFYGKCQSCGLRRNSKSEDA